VGSSPVIVSLDTLDEHQTAFITRADFFNDTKASIEAAIERLPALTKISCVTMRSTLTELSKFVAFAQNLNARRQEGRLALKLNQFFPSNPAQLSDEGEEYWRNEFVDEEAILAALAAADELKQCRPSRTALPSPMLPQARETVRLLYYPTIYFDVQPGYFRSDLLATREPDRKPGFSASA